MRNNSTDHCDSTADRRNTCLAPQQGMGICPQWGSRGGVDNPARSIFNGQDIGLESDEKWGVS